MIDEEALQAHMESMTSSDWWPLVEAEGTMSECKFGTSLPCDLESCPEPEPHCKECGRFFDPELEHGGNEEEE